MHSSNEPNTLPQRWTVTVAEDEDGQLILPFPEDMLAQLGWKEGTNIRWIDNNNGTFTLVENTEESDQSKKG